MPRRPPALLAYCSLACCLLLCGLLGVSWWRSLYVRYTDRAAPQTVGVELVDGVASVMAWRGADGDAAGLEGRVYVSDRARFATPARLRAAVTRFDFYQAYIGRGWAAVVSVPLWVPILITGVGPSWWIRRKRRVGARGFEVRTAATRG